MSTQLNFLYKRIKANYINEHINQETGNCLYYLYSFGWVIFMTLSELQTLRCWMTDELERIWKESILAKLRYYPIIFWRDWGKPLKISLTTAGFLAKFKPSIRIQVQCINATPTRPTRLPHNRNYVTINIRIIINFINALIHSSNCMCHLL
jgi:hypothetical protein